MRNRVITTHLGKILKNQENEEQLSKTKTYFKGFIFGYMKDKANESFLKQNQL